MFALTRILVLLSTLVEFVCPPYTENGQLKRTLRNADNLIGGFCLVNFFMLFLQF